MQLLQHQLEQQLVQLDQARAQPAGLQQAGDSSDMGPPQLWPRLGSGSLLPTSVAQDSLSGPHCVQQALQQGAASPVPGGTQGRLAATLQAPEQMAFWGWAAQPVTIAGGQPDGKPGSSSAADPHLPLLPLHDPLLSGEAGRLFGSQGAGAGPVPLRLLHEQMLSSQDGSGPVSLAAVANLSGELHKLYSAWQSGGVAFADPPPGT